MIIKSKVVTAVLEDIAGREQAGLRKYGTTVDRQDLSPQEWRQHMYEELLDAAVYCKKQIMAEQPLRTLTPHELIEMKEQYLKKIQAIDYEFRTRG